MTSFLDSPLSVIVLAFFHKLSPLLANFPKTYLNSPTYITGIFYVYFNVDTQYTHACSSLILMHADAECQQTFQTLPLQKAKIIQNMQIFAAPIVDGTAIFQTIVSLFGWCYVSIIGDIRLARFIVHESLTGPKKLKKYMHIFAGRFSTLSFTTHFRSAVSRIMVFCWPVLKKAFITPLCTHASYICVCL